MKQLLRVLLLIAFTMGTAVVSTVSYAAEEQSEETQCEGENCPEEEEDPECD